MNSKELNKRKEIKSSGTGEGLTARGRSSKQDNDITRKDLSHNRRVVEEMFLTSGVITVKRKDTPESTTL